MIKKFLKILFYFTIFFSVYSFTSAQVLPLGGNLSLSPKNPGPYENVTIKLESYSFDTTRSNITWYADNKLIASGYGENTISLKTGKEGTQTIVRVSVKTNDNKTYNAGIVLAPQSIDLVWEAIESYTPPFYKGKALPGEGSLVKITALPNFYSDGKKISPSDISYNWSFNDSVVQNLSGYGKQTFTTYLDYLSNENEIKVVAQTMNGDRAEKRITIFPNEIDPIFYESDPTLGANYAKALPDYFKKTGDLFLTVEPYFISGKGSVANNLDYSWSLNGMPVTPTDNTHITLHPKEGYVGVSRIGVSISNTKRILQEIEKKIEISFSE